jgi:mannose-6-phosphate isomerase-like protein (cupin superfamily)
MASTGFLSPIPQELMPTGGGSDQVFYVNSANVTVSYTVPAGKNAMSTGPVTINAGASVTVPANSRWVVI